MYKRNKCSKPYLQNNKLYFYQALHSDTPADENWPAVHVVQLDEELME
jgi:hypothetical protein